MNKKIKIIELLNKIANGEEPPKKIKKEELEGDSFEDLIDNLKYFDKDFSKTLNDEVEILGDNTEEIEKLSIEWSVNEIAGKVDELIKAVNKIRKDLNK